MAPDSDKSISLEASIYNINLLASKYFPFHFYHSLAETKLDGWKDKAVFIFQLHNKTLCFCKHLNWPIALIIVAVGCQQNFKERCKK